MNQTSDLENALRIGARNLGASLRRSLLLPTECDPASAEGEANRRALAAAEVLAEVTRAFRAIAAAPAAEKPDVSIRAAALTTNLAGVLGLEPLQRACDRAAVEAATTTETP